MFYHHWFGGMYEWQNYGVENGPSICTYFQWACQGDTIKRSVGRIKNVKWSNWYALVGKGEFIFRQHTKIDSHYPFYLLYGVTPPLISSEEVYVMRIPSDGAGLVQYFGIEGKLAALQHTETASHVTKWVLVTNYKVGNLVVVSLGKAFQSMKWQSFTSKFCGMCGLVQAKQSL